MEITLTGTMCHNPILSPEFFQCARIPKRSRLGNAKTRQIEQSIMEMMSDNPQAGEAEELANETLDDLKSTDLLNEVSDDLSKEGGQE